MARAWAYTSKTARASGIRVSSTKLSAISRKRPQKGVTPRRGVIRAIAVTRAVAAATAAASQTLRMSRAAVSPRKASIR